MMKAVNDGLEAVNEEVKAVNEGEESLSEEVEAVDNLQNRLPVLELHAHLASRSLLAEMDTHCTVHSYRECIERLHYELFWRSSSVIDSHTRGDL
jgi:hypothetical protein